MLLKSTQENASENNRSSIGQYLQQLSSDRQASSLAGDELERALQLALEVLERGDFHERWEAAKLLPKLGTVAIDPLIEILEDEEADLELRWFAARILGDFDSPTVVTSLINLLQSSADEELVEMAANALGHLGTSAIEALTALLASAETRLLAARSLSQIRHSATITPLLSVVGDPAVEVRVVAIEALSSFHDSRIPPILLAALSDLAALVRKEAVIGLGLRADLREELDLINRLQPLLFDFNIEVCNAAAIAIGRMGTNEAVGVLFEVLKSPATPIPLQISIVRAISWIGTSAALEYLQPGLTFTSEEVCQEIVNLLGRWENPQLRTQATEILIHFLNSEPSIDRSPHIKQSVALALGQLGAERALTPLVQLLADPDVGVKLHAIAALKTLADNLTPELKEEIAIALQEWQAS
ncbi:MAG: HEAT repeat domain-containing protein [Cyanosarcina radialis HA8281-LM2]|jgi:HEAT repeat protein|nr:HEAT repeat domain-containing protein [Cyanosarcina radialis HA8281-LM2]